MRAMAGLAARIRPSGVVRPIPSTAFSKMPRYFSSARHGREHLFVRALEPRAIRLVVDLDEAEDFRVRVQKGRAEGRSDPEATLDLAIDLRVGGGIVGDVRRLVLRDPAGQAAPGWPPM